MRANSSGTAIHRVCDNLFNRKLAHDFQIGKEDQWMEILSGYYLKEMVRELCFSNEILILKNLGCFSLHLNFSSLVDSHF